MSRGRPSYTTSGDTIVEIQDWTNPACFGTLPPSDFPSNYVMELDSYANSSITKIIELHPGTYEFSAWYHGRISDTTSNIIAVYLQAQRPEVSGERLVFRMAQPGSKGWKRFTQSVTVNHYSIYKLTIKAEGTSDTFGGLINAFNVKFIDTNDGT